MSWVEVLPFFIEFQQKADGSQDFWTINCSLVGYLGDRINVISQWLLNPFDQCHEHWLTIDPTPSRSTTQTGKLTWLNRTWINFEGDIHDHHFHRPFMSISQLLRMFDVSECSGVLGTVQKLWNQVQIYHDESVRKPCFCQENNPAWLSNILVV